MIRKKPSSAKKQLPSGFSIQERINARKKGGAAPSSEPSGYDALRAEGGGETRRLQGHGAPSLDDEALLHEYRERLRGRRAYASPPGERSPMNPKSESEDRETPAKGAVLHIRYGEESAVGVFHHDDPEREYQVVYMLGEDGVVRPQGLCLLEAYAFEQIGQLPAEVLEEIQRSKRWDRDEIVFHLNDLKHAPKVPHVREDAAPSLPPEAEDVAEATKTPSGEAEARETLPSERIREHRRRRLQRGQKFRVSIDRNRSWEAVYWGEDEQGTVVAHNTAGQWAFMHFDLERFRDTLEPLDEVLGEKEQYEIVENFKQANAAD